ncbi:hypothetical protein G6011_11555 [Alternaria panax]|uniref:Peptidase S8/S53 domain-containing protein n=1 Tax=Alternaria panax TaxID=48097 RepID=A0AAD4IDM7_9PLEO|nr:hypothetical protein G6011_11555 [Alternaria panax]
MVHISRVTFAAIEFFLSQVSFGTSLKEPVVHLHQRMNSDDQAGAEPAISGDPFNPEVKRSCNSVTASEHDSTKRGACALDLDSTPPIQIVSKDTTKRVKGDEYTPRSYLVSTVNGINRAQYRDFAKKPPLGDKEGDIIAFDEVEWVSCQYLNLTDAKAAIVSQDPIKAWAEPMSEEADEALKNDPAQLPSYVFEPYLGQGQTIYVLDSGHRKTHQEFDASERKVRDFVVPSRQTLAFGSLRDDQRGPEDMTGMTGHGTMVASIAAGYVSSVASKANLVVVKMENSARNPGNPDTRGTGTIVLAGHPSASNRRKTFSVVIDV